MVRRFHRLRKSTSRPSVPGELPLPEKKKKKNEKKKKKKKKEREKKKGRRKGKKKKKKGRGGKKKKKKERKKKRGRKRKKGKKRKKKKNKKTKEEGEKKNKKKKKKKKKERKRKKKKQKGKKKEKEKTRKKDKKKKKKKKQVRDSVPLSCPSFTRQRRPFHSYAVRDHRLLHGRPRMAASHTCLVPYATLITTCSCPSSAARLPPFHFARPATPSRSPSWTLPGFCAGLSSSGLTRVMPSTLQRCTVKYTNPGLTMNPSPGACGLSVYCGAPGNDRPRSSPSSHLRPLLQRPRGTLPSSWPFLRCQVHRRVRSSLATGGSTGLACTPQGPVPWRYGVIDTPLY